MITSDDIEFHPNAPTNRLWTETTYLAFNVPEAALQGTLYVLARPNMGVALSSVVIARGIRRHPHEVDFCDPQIHLPCPAAYSRFKLENGLALEASSLTDWHFTYEHQLGACRFDLTLNGAHRPYDAADPAENPLSGATPHTDPRVGDAWSNGHFDLKGRITGSLELYGKSYQIDCHEGMDRSWGPRNETPNRASAYISANFGDEMAMWLTMPLNISSGGKVSYDTPRSGFIVEGSVVTPIVEAAVRATTVDMLAMNDHIVVVDAKGRRFELYGSAIGTRPMGSVNPSISAFLSLMRYQWRGKVGHGGHGKLFGQTYLGRHMSGAEAEQ
ncbi:DUF7065 domain-containing protein [Candidimonas nitroreducens]|uniref:DUF7065 domain-containing protein n=1 Tax=Candidimonas nitroreducens TaxID=683354 RepID=A0A225MZ12_9BURK|nr:hypothetical protein [Candidimonas nitroreducens]OWT66354.1 hypothetical protein CEY11_01055 [Candidimonas nitroreducens]